MYLTFRGRPLFPLLGEDVVDWQLVFDKLFFLFGHCKCESKCCFNLSCLANIRGQMLQANGLSPVWTLLCLAKWEARVKARVQRSQEKGLYWALSDFDINGLVSFPSFIPVLFEPISFFFLIVNLELSSVLLDESWNKSILWTEHCKNHVCEVIRTIRTTSAFTVMLA